MLLTFPETSPAETFSRWQPTLLPSERLPRARPARPRSGWLRSGIMAGLGLLLLGWATQPGGNVLDDRFVPLAAYGLLLFAAPVLVVMVWSGAMAVVAFRSGPAWRTHGRHRLFHALFPAACAALLWYDVPLRACFWLHRPGLEALAEEALGDPRLDVRYPAPRTVGLYAVTGTGGLFHPSRNPVHLHLDPGHADGAGFIYSPGAPVTSTGGLPRHRGAVHHMHVVDLGGGWYKYVLLYDD
jgi:hypothetical protein